jgi:hypothetical protein
MAGPATAAAKPAIPGVAPTAAVTTPGTGVTPVTTTPAVSNVPSTGAAPSIPGLPTTAATAGALPGTSIPGVSNAAAMPGGLQASPSPVPGIAGVPVAGVATATTPTAGAGVSTVPSAMLGLPVGNPFGFSPSPAVAGVVGSSPAPGPFAAATGGVFGTTGVATSGVGTQNSTASATNSIIEGPAVPGSAVAVGPITINTAGGA